MITGDWIEALQEFNEIAGDHWKKTLNRMLREKECDPRLKAVFKKLTVYVKHLLVENRTTELEELQEFLHNDILYHLLLKYEEEKVSLVNCYVEKLELFYLEGQTCQGDMLIEELFQNVIIYTNPSFSKNNYLKYGFDTEHELLNLGNAMDSIVMEAVKERLSVSAMRDFLSYKFPTAEEMVNKISEEYEQYYDALRRRYGIELKEALQDQKTDKIVEIVNAQ